MHLNKLIELFEKNVSMYNNPVELATLEHLRRLQHLEGLKPGENPARHILSLTVLAAELGTTSVPVYRLMRDDPDAPAPVPSPDGKRNQHNYYVRDEFYAWWNNRKKK